jgi:hypothetical protein
LNWFVLFGDTWPAPEPLEVSKYGFPWRQTGVPVPLDDPEELPVTAFTKLLTASIKLIE